MFHEKQSVRVAANSRGSDNIKLVFSEDGLQVQKIGGARLFRQFEKQRDFSPSIHNGVTITSTPVAINKSGETVTGIMPFINGATGSEIIYLNSINDVKLAITALFSSIEINIAESKLERIHNKTFLDKLNTIRPNIGEILYQRSFDYINKSNHYAIPIGNCHGDLTLSNIIVPRRDTLYLIDFLDSYVESPLQDLAKLKQDMIHQWSFRNDRKVDQLQARIILNHAWNDGLKTYPQLKRFGAAFKCICLLNLLRIMPYAQGGDDVRWIEAAFNREIEDQDG